MPHVDRMTLLVQALDEKESNKYFTLPQNVKCKEDGRLKSNKV
jgi:hypothetical protein